jgi:hypothetical protein
MFRTVSLLIACILMISCQPSVEENVIAQVNEEKLSLEELKANFTEQQWKNLTKEEKEEMVQDWIRLTLLAQEAEKNGISDQQLIKNRLQTARKNILANALIAQNLAKITVTDEELFNYYRLHKNNYQKTHKEYRVQRIFVQSESLLDSVRAAIKSTSFK